MPENSEKNHSISRAVVIWLIIGLVMVFFQIVIGGVTRLTGSGLSITKWEIVTGVLPPLSESSWIKEFEKYKNTPQYKKINTGMELGSIFRAGSFKFIYFWEYLHRLWARTMGFVFLLPFLFFYWKKKIPDSLLKGLGYVVLLASLAAMFGWIMVASGLVHRPWVNAYKLAIHLCIGISVFIALWWAFLKYIYNNKRPKEINAVKYLQIMFALLIVQIFFGGVMSGTKAALFINTWPDLNGEYLPGILMEGQNWTIQNFDNYEQSGFLVTLVQFLHRGSAYLIFVLTFFIFFHFKYWKRKSQVSLSFILFLSLIIIQVMLGVITLKFSTGIIPVYWGVLHQGFAVFVLAGYVLHMFYSSYSNIVE